MARHTLLLVVAALLTSGVASAQVAMGAARPPGIRIHTPPRAPKPEPPPATPQPQPPPAREDLFRARPDTYRPRHDSPYFFPAAAFYPVYSAPEVVVQPVIVERTIVVEQPASPKRASAEAGAQPTSSAPAPVIVGVKKTVYVIPRCYAGDKPPDASRLAPGCDIRDMKVIPPG